MWVWLSSTATGNGSGGGGNVPSRLCFLALIGHKHATPGPAFTIRSPEAHHPALTSRM